MICSGNHPTAVTSSLSVKEERKRCVRNSFRSEFHTFVKKLFPITVYFKKKKSLFSLIQGKIGLLYLVLVWNKFQQTLNKKCLVYLYNITKNQGLKPSGEMAQKGEIMHIRAKKYPTSCTHNKLLNMSDCWSTK